MGCVSSAQLNIPIVHIEGCMRSYDWRMPEEKYRTVIDNLSDVIYTYFPEYKEQGIREGLNPNSIVVVQNLIVDVIETYFSRYLPKFREVKESVLFMDRSLKQDEFILTTCHRRENVENEHNLRAIINLLGESPFEIIFPASYRTQKRIRDFKVSIPQNVTVVDPIGYEEMMKLMSSAYAVITDSGTVVEETAILGVPSVQMRMSTERPQVYDCGSSVKFDPSRPTEYPSSEIYRKLSIIKNTSWEHNLGDGKASERIVDDLISRSLTPGGFSMHSAENTHHDISRSYREDSINS